MSGLRTRRIPPPVRATSPHHKHHSVFVLRLRLSSAVLLYVLGRPAGARAPSEALGSSSHSAIRRQRPRAQVKREASRISAMALLQERTPLLLKTEPFKLSIPVAVKPAAPHEPDVDIKAEFLALLSMALQVSLSTFARLALTSVDYAFLGHLGTKELAVASLSSAWTSVPLMGVWADAGALTTLCGQAWGAKNGDLAGVWLQMGLVITSIFIIPVFVWYWCVGYALEISTDDPEVIRLGVRFARIMSFASWPAVLYACVRLYFQAMGIMTPNTVVGTISIGVAVAANYFLIYGCFDWNGLGFDGSPLATVIASWFQPIASVSYCILYKKMHLQAWGDWSLGSFTRDRLRTYANIAIPVASNSLISNLASSALSLIAAKLGSDVIAANAVMSGLWMNCLGANRPKAAKALAQLGFGCTIICVLLLAALTFSLHEKLFHLYTTDGDFLKLWMFVQPIFIVSFVVESIEILIASVLNAMGEAKVVAWISTISTWCIEQPIAYVGGVTLGYGFPTLWYSICTMKMIKLTVYLIKLSRTDWTRMTPVPTPSSVSKQQKHHQWGDEVENGLHIRRSRAARGPPVVD